MNSLIQLLLILDLSGSMDQNLSETGRSKVSVLKQTATQVMTSALVDPQQKIQMTYFGTDPARACSDIKNVAGNSKTIVEQFKKLRPGALGKTPLAKTLLQVKQNYSQTKPKDILLLTDGGDSCGEDPCKALLALDGEVAKQNGKMRFNLIGIDQNIPESNLKCFLDIQLQLKAIDFSILTVSNSSALLANLARAMAKAKEGKDKKTDSSESSKRNSSEKDKAGGAEGAEDLAQAAKEITDDLTPPKKMAILTIAGASEDAVFRAMNASGVVLEWQGPLPQIFKPTKMKILLKTSLGETQDIELTLKSEEKRSIPFGQFFKNALVNVKFAPQKLSVKLTPSPATLLANPQAAPVVVTTDTTVPIYFGNYLTEIENPWWLRAKVNKKWNLLPVPNQEWSGDVFFADELQWHDSGSDAKAISVGGEKVLVLPGQKIPYLKNTKVKNLKLKARHQ